MYSVHSLCVQCVHVPFSSSSKAGSMGIHSTCVPKKYGAKGKAAKANPQLSRWQCKVTHSRIGWKAAAKCYASHTTSIYTYNVDDDATAECCRAVLLPNARFKSFLLLTASVFCSCCYCYYSHVCSVSSLVDGTVISVHFRWGYKHTHTHPYCIYIKW